MHSHSGRRSAASRPNGNARREPLLTGSIVHGAIPTQMISWREIERVVLSPPRVCGAWALLVRRKDFRVEVEQEEEDHSHEVFGVGRRSCGCSCAHSACVEKGTRDSFTFGRNCIVACLHLPACRERAPAAGSEETIFIVLPQLRRQKCRSEFSDS